MHLDNANFFLTMSDEFNDGEVTIWTADNGGNWQRENIDFGDGIIKIKAVKTGDSYKYARIKWDKEIPPFGPGLGNGKMQKPLWY